MSRKDAIQRGEGVGLAVLDWAQAVLYNGLGRYDEARRGRAFRLFEYPHDIGGPINWGMVEFDRGYGPDPEHRSWAVDICSRLGEMARASGTDWAPRGRRAPRKRS